MWFLFIALIILYYANKWGYYNTISDGILIGAIMVLPLIVAVWAVSR